MSRKGPDWDAIVREVGLVVIGFQAIENEVLQLALTASGHFNWVETKDALVTTRFRELVQRSRDLIPAALIRSGRGTPEYVARVNALLDECHEIADARNSAVHSAYVELKAGGELVAVLRSDARAISGQGVAFDRRPVNAGSFEDLNTRMGEMCWNLSVARKQLIHWI